ncbi:hypothetical protein [Roseibium aggregatum]|uniref:hypothetical protein n=1 Tax=Roseibium aggregatum TaxID=187304 RepID=UPI001E43F72F|nr:hypothetical protein [Roseibium aggregatum]
MFVFSRLAALCYGVQYPSAGLSPWYRKARRGSSRCCFPSYIALLKLAASVDDLHPDDPNAKEITLPDISQIYKAVSTTLRSSCSSTS